MKKRSQATNENTTEGDQETRDDIEQVSETTGDRPETTRDRPENTSQRTETVQETTQTLQERLDNNLEELHRSAEDILNDYKTIAIETAPLNFYEELAAERIKHKDFQTKILDKNADLKKTSAEKTLAPVIEKETIANDNAVITDQDNLMKDLDKRLEDSGYKPYENEMTYGLQIDMEIKVQRRNELLAEREEYLRTRNLELQELISNARLEQPDSDFDINERSESGSDFES
jgi:hypothetical protein